MLRGLTTATGLLVLSACISDAGEARLRATHWTFESCDSICSVELDHDRGKLTLNLRDESMTTVAISTGRLTEVGSRELATLEIALTRSSESLKAHECIDCEMPQQIRIGWVEGPLTTYGFASEPPRELADMHSFASDLRDALAMCTATADIEPTADCTATVLP